MDITLLQKLLASIFIISFVILQLFWCLPEGNVMRKIIHKLFFKPVVWCGLDHYWSLFAPNPVADIYLISFKIEFTNGTSVPWELPEFKVKDGFQNLEKARHLKWYYSLLSPEDDAPRKGICAYILRSFLEAPNTAEVPRFIHIIYHFKPRTHSKIFKHAWLKHVAYTYNVES